MYGIIVLHVRLIKAVFICKTKWTCHMRHVVIIIFIKVTIDQMIPSNFKFYLSYILFSFIFTDIRLENVNNQTKHKISLFLN